MRLRPTPTPAVLPNELEPRRLRRRAAPIVAALVVAAVVVLLAPGLGQLRDRLAGADPGWLALAVAFEALSGMSYVLMFRPVFCPRMPWRTSWEISWSELAVGSLVPASGAGGLALGAWILHEAGMPAERIGRRSVAFFLIKSAANFVAVAVLGTAMAVGLVGPQLSLWLTAGPAVAAVLVMAAVAAVPRLGRAASRPPTRAGFAGLWLRFAGRWSVASRRRSGSSAHGIHWSCSARSVTGPGTTPCCGQPSMHSAIHRPSRSC